MLERAAGLSPRALEAIAELEREVVDADGGRLKLEWGALRSRSGERVGDLLWWDGDRLRGFLGFYGYGASLELAGMVAPAARRQGIATALLDAAMPLCREQGYAQVLLIVPRSSAAGKRLALGRGGALDHSEHALVPTGEPAPTAAHPELTLRRATESDLPVLARLLEQGFGGPAPGLEGRLNSPLTRILMVEVEASPVGTLSLSRDGDTAGIYGFVIDAPRQGQGLGRAALGRACAQLRAEGVRRIGLEVEVQNDHALGLYTSAGFAPVTTEDYYRLPLT
ncbi:MAG TPA: GNAT family N-acetyltransferase [Solirubrobacteraceae bacterium]|nr:GNAT family N-acetyltransferase [Solirubrobacteraceae bacterium]